MEKTSPFLLLFTALIFYAFSSARSQPYLGVNYGEVADNLPSPDATAQLLRSTTFSKLRLYNADPTIIKSMAGTGIYLILGVSNGDIPVLAADPSAASSWVASNILPFLPATSIATVSVGNEVLNAGDPALSSQLLPAMQNLHTALSSSAATAAIKVSTVHSMAVLSQSDPPSSGALHVDLLPSVQSILQFLRDNGSPFMINPYPYFAYKSDPRPETLSFCLFQPNPGRVDPGTGITYSNMFDAQVDAVRVALRAAGFDGEEVVVAETGWPYRGDDGEPGPSVDNARAYNGNLVAHLRSMANPVETYIFALYDEDLKPGPLSERSFGLFHPNLTPLYDAGLMNSAGMTATPAETLKPTEGCAPGVGGGSVCGKPSVQYLPSISAAIAHRGLPGKLETCCWLLGLSFVLAFLDY